MIKLSSLLLLLAASLVHSSTDIYGNQLMGSDYKLTGVGLGWDYLEVSLMIGI